jgi:hypothetical protein
MRISENWAAFHSISENWAALRQFQRTGPRSIYICPLSNLERLLSNSKHGFKGELETGCVE